MNARRVARVASVGALTIAFALSPFAQAAAANTSQIGDPVTDTVQLWSEIAASIEQVTREVASVFQHPTQSQAAAAVTPEGTPPQSEQPTPSPASTPTPEPTTTLTTQTILEYAPQTNDAVGIGTKLNSLIDIVANLASLISASRESQTASTNQQVAADGNPEVPYAAASNIGNLSGVTISNANLTTSEIPALDYLSLSGGSLSGNLSVSGNATTTGTSYFSGNVGIGTSTSLDALALNGSTFLANITAPSLTANRLYANSGSLYWAGNLIAGAATGNWTSDGTNVWRTGGNVGIGTTSPFAALSVVGNGYLTGSLTAASINAINGTTTNATSTNLFSTFGNFTTGLINTLSGTTLSYTAASTTNFSNTGTAYFGGSNQTTIDSAGDVNVGGSLIANGNVTFGSATSTNLFATTASLGSLSLSSPLSVASGGTGWASIASGYIPFGNGGSALATSSSFYWDNADGRLGIGTTTPNNVLSIQSTTANMAGTSSVVDLTSSGSSFLTFGRLGMSNSGVINSPLASLLLQTTGGDVGIGTTSPSASLSVGGSGYFSGTISTAQPASTDDSNTLVSSGWVDQFFPGLTTSSWLGTPGLDFTNCASQSTCGWTIEQNITQPSEDDYATFGSFKDETQIGGSASDRESNGNFDTVTSPYGVAWDRVIQGILHNDTLASENAQQVAVNGYAWRQDQTGTTTSYEPSSTWGGWFVCNDTTGLADPTHGCIGTESDIYVAPGGGADPNGQRVGLLVGASASSNDPGVHIAYGIKIESAASSTIDNGIYFSNCSECTSASEGFYGNYISDGLGHVKLTSAGSLTLNSATTSPGLLLSGTGSYGSSTLELNKTGSGYANSILANTNGIARWGVQLGNAAAESGSNLGSDFEIDRYSDTGSSLGSPLVILRASGDVGISTTTPDSALTVQTTAATAMDLTSAGSQFLTLGRVSGSNSGVINSPLASLILQSGGQSLGIGTTTPQTLVHVWGSTADLRIQNSASSTAYTDLIDAASNNQFQINKTVSSGVADIDLNPLTGDGASGVAVRLFRSTNTTGGGTFQIFQGNNSQNTQDLMNSDGNTEFNLLAGNFGVGTSTPGTVLSINSIANFSSATTSFYSTGGINLAGGCFAISGSCIPTPWAVSASNVYSASGNSIGIGTSTPDTTLTVQTTAATAMDLTSSGSQFLTFGRVAGTDSGVVNSPLGSLILQSGGAGRDIGIGTSTPYSKLEVWGPDTASTTAFLVANNASTTEFSVYDTGNAVLAGSLTQNSDERLKTNIQSLNASSSLSLIDELNPVTFNWIDPNKGSTLQLGFIAQQVQTIFPNLVSTTSPTALTPDGTLSLNYIDLISPIVSAIQALSSDITSIENTIAGFAQSFTTNELTFDRATGQELCLSDNNGTSCYTRSELDAAIAAANASQDQGSSGSSSDNSSASSTPDTPPVIQINGGNPATVQVGATYNDLGATITGPQADLNLGIMTYVNGVETSPVQIDTSEAATDTVDYVVTDQNGLTSTSTRTVVIQAVPASTPVAATSSEASSTSQ